MTGALEPEEEGYQDATNQLTAGIQRTKRDKFHSNTTRKFGIMMCMPMQLLKWVNHTGNRKTKQGPESSDDYAIGESYRGATVSAACPICSKHQDSQLPSRHR